MDITNVRIRLSSKEDSKLKAYAAITIDDCFVVHNIKVIKGQDELFIAMPSTKAADGSYKDIAHPINTDARKMLSDRILEEYDKAVSQVEIAE